jgi:YVTN family beta-propeller protein
MPALLAVALAACGGHGDAADPTTVPIAPVTGDAVYVVDGADATITVIDAETDAVIDTIAIADGPYPHHVYLSPDGASLYLAIPGLDLSGGHGGGGHGDGHATAFVLRLDAATGRTDAVARLPATNHNAAPSPDGQTVWTSQMTEPGAVLVLDAATLAEVDRIDVGSQPAEVTFAPDGSVAVVANGGSDDVSIIDVTSRAVLATVAVGDNPVGAWPGVDGRLYVDNETGQSISALDPATRQVVQTIALGFTPAFAAVHDGELWVTDTDSGRVVFFDLATGEATGELATGAGAHALAFDAAHTRAWVTNQAADTVSVIDVAARTVRATVAVGGAPNGIAVRELP